MDLFYRLSQMTSKPVGAATIGNFDGFHRGHQCLVSQVVQKGKGEGGSLLVTFEPHPREILNPQVRVPRLSSDWTQLCGHFEAAGLDEVLQLQTSREFLKLTAVVVSNFGLTQSKKMIIVKFLDMGHKEIDFY